MSVIAAGLLEHCCAGHLLEDVVRVLWYLVVLR